jgi:hypothetical protein
MNKKGSITDAIYGPAKILSVVVVFFICFYIWNSFNNVFTTDIIPGLSPFGQEQLTAAISNIDIGIRGIEYVLPLLVGGLLMVSLIFAYKTGANVIYAILSLFVWILALLMSAIFANTFEQVNTAFGYTNTFPIIFYLMSNIKWIVLGWLALITIVMFTRDKREQDAISAQEMAFSGGSPA